MTSSTLTDDEAKLYDRSIRLWGVEAQSRIRNTSVLLVGLGGLNGEVCKNVALAGVKCIGLLDGAPLSAADIGALFLASPEHVGALSRAAACEAFVRDLNPYVNVVVERSDAAAAHDDAFWARYDIVCATKQSWSVLQPIADACRRAGVKFYAGDCLGFFGFMFADLGPRFTFSKTVESDAADGEKLTTRSMEQLDFASLAELLARVPARPKRVPPLYWALLVLRNRELHGNSTAITASNAKAVLAQAVADGALPSADLITPELLVAVTRGVGVEVPCVAAVLGGILGQELIRAAAADDVPIQGFLLYDAYAGTAIQLNE
jgi:ubiquitin-like 1-activating enzyme E1 A